MVAGGFRALHQLAGYKWTVDKQGGRFIHRPPVNPKSEEFPHQMKEKRPKFRRYSSSGGTIQSRELLMRRGLNATLLDEWKSPRGSDTDYNVSAIQGLIL